MRVHLVSIMRPLVILIVLLLGLTVRAGAQPMVGFEAGGQGGQTVTVRDAGGFSWFVLTGDRERMVLDFTERASHAAAPPSGAIIRGVRSAPRGEGTRIVLDLEGPTRILQSRVGGEVVFRLSQGTTESFSRLAARGVF